MVLGIVKLVEIGHFGDFFQNSRLSIVFSRKKKSRFLENSVVAILSMCFMITLDNLLIDCFRKCYGNIFFLCVQDIFVKRRY